MSIFELGCLLFEMPENERTQFAYNYVKNLSELGHGIYNILASLPKEDRAKFLKDHLSKIENTYVFSRALGSLPDEDRFEFAKQNYSFFTLKKRISSAALGCILSLLPENVRLDFALSFSDEIHGSTSWLLRSVLKELPQISRFEFLKTFLSDMFIQSGDMLAILQLLNEKDRLNFYSISNGDYLSYDELECGISLLILPNDLKQFLEINKQKMLMSLLSSEALSYKCMGDGLYPIYGSLQRAFNSIESDIKSDEQKSDNYASISSFFNHHYGVNSKPYNASLDNQHIYIRDLESRSVASLIQTSEPDLNSSIVDLITQYSGHYLDAQLCQNRTLELESISQDDLSWTDLIYLHENTLGLRGVTNDDMAVNEARIGGCGDAISLANFGQGKNSEFLFSYLKDEETMDKCYPDIKSKLLNAIKSGLKWHIHASLMYGYNVAFELINRGDSALCPYDFGESYPLGKCGKTDFKASDITALILRRDCPTWDVESIYRFVVSAIKKLRLDHKCIQLCNSADDNQQVVEFSNESLQYSPRFHAKTVAVLSELPATQSSKFLGIPCALL